MRPTGVAVAWPAGGGVDQPTRIPAIAMGRFLRRPLVPEGRGKAAPAARDGWTTVLSDGHGPAAHGLPLQAALRAGGDPAGGTPAKLGATAAAHTTAMWDRAGPAAAWPAQAFCGRAPRRCAMA